MIPRWVTALQWAGKTAWYVYRTEEVVRDELLRAWLDPEVRPLVTERDYARASSYLPGGATFERGLFDWESDVLASLHFPKSGRILLGAAGGGRELLALSERGFEVVAFEPNARLRAGAEAVARAHPRASVIDATYADLVQAARGRTGPLADVVASGPFDGVILGWGSLTHLMTSEEHLELLKATRACAPCGPTLISFFMRPTAPNGNSERLRAGLRALFSTLGAKQPPDGIGYEMGTGFVYYFTEEEVHRLAFEAGYEVAHLRAHSFPHAVLKPLSAG